MHLRLLLFCNNICCFCSHWECSDSCLNVSIFCECMFMKCDWAKNVLCYFWLCNLLILVFAIVLQLPLTYIAWEEIIKLYLHNSLSHMSALSMALWFDGEWNIIQLLSFPSKIVLVESRKSCSFHWLPTDFFESLTHRRVFFL